MSQCSVNVSMLFMVGDEGITAKIKECKVRRLTNGKLSKLIHKISRISDKLSVSVSLCYIRITWVVPESGQLVLNVRYSDFSNVQQ